MTQHAPSHWAFHLQDTLETSETVDTTRFEQEEVAAERLLKLYHSTHDNELYLQEKCRYQKSTLKYEVLPQVLETYSDPWTSDIQDPWMLP
jgi:hypothetical protein